MSGAMSDKSSSLGIVGWVFILVGALLMLGPFYFMFVFATHTKSDIFSVPPPAKAPVKRVYEDSDSDD